MPISRKISANRVRAHVMKPGVYAITNTVTGQRYYGGSIYPISRFTHHRFMLRRGIHKCIALQKSWNEYGETSHIFEVLEHCDKSQIDSIEQRYLMTQCLNTSKQVAGGTKGISRSLESRMRSSVALRRHHGTPPAGTFDTTRTERNWRLVRLAKADGDFLASQNSELST